jgi:hypothetical protein
MQHKFRCVNLESLEVGERGKRAAYNPHTYRSQWHNLEQKS